MIRFVNIALVFLALGCSSGPIETPAASNQTQKVLAEDRKNKELELFYLAEIRVAQENNDVDAFEFYLEEYLKVPRLDIPEEWKSEPGYFQGGDRVKY